LATRRNLIMQPSELVGPVPGREAYLEFMLGSIYDNSLSSLTEWESFHSGIGNSENVLEMLLQHKMQLATEALDNALIRALVVGNLMAARILASYGAQNTSRATILRAEFINSIYSGKLHKLISLVSNSKKPSSPSWLRKTVRIRAIERFSKCIEAIDWLLGGIYELSPLEDDMLLWRIPNGMEGNVKVVSMERGLNVLREICLGFSKPARWCWRADVPKLAEISEN
jgi:hypothetical protein